MVNVRHSLNVIYEINDGQQHSPRVTRKRQERMQGILAAALEVAREDGRDALTVHRVAERLDVTPGALYRYFASKDALVAELQRTIIAWLADSTRQHIEALQGQADVAGLDTGERALLRAVVTALCFETFARSSPVEFGLLTMYLASPEFALPEDDALHVFRAAAQSLQGLAHHLEAAAEAGALSDGIALDRAIALWAGLQGVVQTRKLARSAGGRIDPERIARSLLSALLVGWGADAERVERIVALARIHTFAESSGSVDELLRTAPH
jgi:AcrR family transcriptional regulator